MRTAVLLSIRNKARRLPRKHFLYLCGKTTTARLIERLRLATEPERIILCTSVHPDDDAFEAVAREEGTEIFRGSEDDKLRRYLDAARRWNLDFVVIVDGDDLLCDPGYIDRVVRHARGTAADYVLCEGLPLGVAPCGLRVAALERACREKREEKTEVWGGYFTRGDYRIERIQADDRHRAPDWRLTLDYEEDYEVFRRIFDELGRGGGTFSLDAVMDFLRAHPEVRAINRGAQARYEENLRRTTRDGVSVPSSDTL